MNSSNAILPALLKRMEECVDGDTNRSRRKAGLPAAGVLRQVPRLLSCQRQDRRAIGNLHPAGRHGSNKVYNAYRKANQSSWLTTVILAQTVKGYGLAANQARNASTRKRNSQTVTGAVREALRSLYRNSRRQLGKPIGLPSSVRLRTSRSAAKRWVLSALP